MPRAKPVKNILRALMDPSRPDTVPWASRELREMLLHQLRTPLLAEVDRFAQIMNCSAIRLQELPEKDRSLTFGDILRHPTPAPEILQFVKEFAKASLTTADDLPRDVARIIYLMAILRGRSSGFTSISSMDRASLERETRRCLTFGWLPEAVAKDLRSLRDTAFRDD